MDRSALLSNVTAAAVFAAVFLGPSSAAGAADDLKSLQEALNIISQEQQAVFQQFQMIQELRRRDAQATHPSVLRQVGPPGNYDEVVAARKAQVEREEYYSRQLDELYSRHRDLDRQRQSITEAVQKLRAAPRPPGG